MKCQYCLQSNSVNKVLGFHLCTKCQRQLNSANVKHTHDGVVYCRVSTKKQSEDPTTGVFIQIRTCIEYCCSNNIKCHGIYTDVHSGFNMTNTGLHGLYQMFNDLGYNMFIPRMCKTKNPTFKNVVNAIRNSKQVLLIPDNPVHMDMIIVANIDRFGRDIQNMIGIRNQLKTNNTDIVSASQSFSTRDSLGDLQFVKQALEAEAFSRDKSIRIKNVKKSQKALGHYIGGCPPYGRKVVYKNGIRSLVDDTHEQAIIHYIDKLYNKEHMSKSDIAKLLNKKGTLKRGKTWTMCKIIYVLNAEDLPDISKLTITPNQSDEEDDDSSDEEDDTSEEEDDDKSTNKGKTFDDDMDTTAV